MVSFSSKDYSTASNYPRALSSIIVSVGLLAVLLTFASWTLLSNPIGSVVRSYFYEVVQAHGLDSSSVSWRSEGGSTHKSDEMGGGLPKSMTEGTSEVGQSRDSSLSRDVTFPQKPNNENFTPKMHKETVVEGTSDVVSSSIGSTLQKLDNENSLKKENTKSVDVGSNDVASRKPDSTVFSGKDDTSQVQGDEKPLQTENKESTDIVSNDSTSVGLPDSEISDNKARNKDSVIPDCDLFHGEWFYDSAGPVYTNNSCPVITQMQNCQGNGRPDKEYENWRWKPSQCELPRFNGTKFLELMSGKSLAFVGDSVARNQMESLLCLLRQVETPKNRGNRHMQRWYFRSKSVMIIRIWSSWLVHQTSEAFSYVPEGIAKLHLDVPDEGFMQYIPNFDVVILSSGHWFAKQSIYMLNNEIVGTQLWSPPKNQQMKINNIEAFGISVETSMAAMATHPNYTGLTILRSYSPDHYEGGAWNTGGSCTGKVKPVLPGQLVKNEFTNIMHEQQVRGYHRGVKKQTNKSKLKLMDITDVFSYRHDGHPGPYRSPDPNKITKRGPDGKPPPQDCLHWCMPGPVDTWNELVLEIIRREFEGNQKSTS